MKHGDRLRWREAQVGCQATAIALRIRTREICPLRYEILGQEGFTHLGGADYSGAISFNMMDPSLGGGPSRDEDNFDAVEAMHS